MQVTLEAPRPTYRGQIPPEDAAPRRPAAPASRPSVPQGYPTGSGVPAALAPRCRPAGAGVPRAAADHAAPAAGGVGGAGPRRVVAGRVSALGERGRVGARRRAAGAAHRALTRPRSPNITSVEGQPVDVGQGRRQPVGASAVTVRHGRLFPCRRGPR